MNIVEVTPETISTCGLYCVKNKSNPGNYAKSAWYEKAYKDGLRMLIATDNEGNQLGMIEYTPIENAWRPILGKNYLFIQCLVLFAKQDRTRGVASNLIQSVCNKSLELKLAGVCTITSNGAWMAGKEIFIKNGFSEADSKSRFELLVKENEPHDLPKFSDWEKYRNELKGWNLFYTDQCPWLIKSVEDLKSESALQGVDLQISKIDSAFDAQHSPTGYGTFSLIRDGRELADHYISRTRFKNILRKELEH